MAVLTEIVRNVLVIVLVTGFLEMLLPEGSMKPLVRLCIGMFILIAVLNPVLGFMFHGRDFQIQSWDYQPEAVEPAIDIAAEGSKVHQALVGQTKKAAKAKLEEQISAVAVLVPGVDKVDSEIEVDEAGQVHNLILTVQTGAGGAADDASVVKDTGNSDYSDRELERIEAKIGNLMHSFYGIEENAIKIEFEGG